MREGVKLTETTEDEGDEEPSSMLNHVADVDKSEDGKEEGEDVNGDLRRVLVSIEVDFFVFGHCEFVDRLTLTY
jgi:hypothetical protein